MYKFVIRCINGFQGSSYYRTYTKALEAAKVRTSINGIPWYVDVVKVG